MDLIARLRAKNPTASNTKLGKIASKDLQIPKAPHGFSEASFLKATTSVKNAVADLNIDLTHSWATGSPVTGVTTNPKKEFFGLPKEKFVGSDLDITLVTSKNLSNSQIEK